jgi:hypothetical protein
MAGPNVQRYRRFVAQSAPWHDQHCQFMMPSWDETIVVVTLRNRRDSSAIDLHLKAEPRSKTRTSVYNQATIFGARVRLTNAPCDKDYGNESNKQKEPAGEVPR